MASLLKQYRHVQAITARTQRNSLSITRKVSVAMKYLHKNEESASNVNKDRTDFLNNVDKYKTTADIQDSFSFAKLLRDSSYIDIGKIEGRVVIGIVKETHGDEVFIDFGGKFYCVCKRPVSASKTSYKRGAQVRIRLQDLELSACFLGATRDNTLLEADAVLLGLMDNKSDNS